MTSGTPTRDVAKNLGVSVPSVPLSGTALALTSDPDRELTRLMVDSGFCESLTYFNFPFPFVKRPLKNMRILTYKRTHTGDPDTTGQFGINDCMGRVRSWNYDAVIGIGGMGTEPRSNGIEGRVTWIGLNPMRRPHPKGFGEIVTFEHFVLHDQDGRQLRELAPRLAQRMYEKGARVLIKSYSRDEKLEAERLITELIF